eukprot:8533086-Ditylum_brightwellii.AAC.1
MGVPHGGHMIPAQQITDTICFEHHNAMVPTVTLAEIIEKAAKELTKAVYNNPTEEQADYIEAVQ